jgi:hypothetical protein
MSRSKLRLVHDVSGQSDVRVARETWGYENARQLSLFQDDERDCLFLVTMNAMDKFSFKNLLDSKRPSSIVDTRRYPDFFGFFKSTQVALTHFDNSSIDYIHVPLKNDFTNEVESIWDFRSNLLDCLQKTKGECGLFGQTFLVLVPSEDFRGKCQKLLRSLPTFDQNWRLEQL